MAVKRFLREAELGQRVAHPYIVKTFDFGQDDGLYFLALEWVEGEPLADFASRSGQLAPPLVATIIEQVGGGARRHAQPRHHPSRPEAGEHHVRPRHAAAKLLDFGIARDAETSADERLTRAGFFVGTLQYVAPETLSGALVDEQADVYSLATIAYYLLTGHAPLPGQEPAGAVPAAADAEPGAAQPGREGAQVHAGHRGGGHAGAERDLAKRTKTVDEFSQDFCTAVRETDDQKGGGFLKDSSASDRRRRPRAPPPRALGAPGRLRARQRGHAPPTTSIAA